MKQFSKEQISSMKRTELKEMKNKIDELCNLELKKFSKKMKLILKKEGLVDIMDANISFKWVLKD